MLPIDLEIQLAHHRVWEFTVEFLEGIAESGNAIEGLPADDNGALVGREVVTVVLEHPDIEDSGKAVG